MNNMKSELQQMSMLKDTIAALKDEVAFLSKLLSKLQKERSDQTSSNVPATHPSYATVAQAAPMVPKPKAVHGL